jgi:hypothetical protein
MFMFGEELTFLLVAKLEWMMCLYQSQTAGGPQWDRLMPQGAREEQTIRMWLMGFPLLVEEHTPGGVE